MRTCLQNRRSGFSGGIDTCILLENVIYYCWHFYCTGIFIVQFCIPGVQTSCCSGQQESKVHMDVKKYFKKSGLIPAIVTDAENGEVLMLAYMNEESLQKTLETGYTWFWSRSRQELWNKGATSGHFQKVVEMYSDCDDDTLLIKVIQTGAACHTGHRSCFFTRIK